MTFRSDTYPALSLPDDGGALLVGYTQALGTDRRNLWGIKVPAKNGEIAFDEAAPAHARDLPSEGDARFCPTLEEYPIDPVEHSLTPISMEISVQDASIRTTTQTPD